MSPRGIPVACCLVAAAAGSARAATAQCAGRGAAIRVPSGPVRLPLDAPADPARPGAFAPWSWLSDPRAIVGAGRRGPVPAAPELGAAPRRVPRDSWIAEDKARHLIASFVLTAFAFAGANAAGLDWPDAGAAAGSLAFGGGVVKELRDSSRGGPFSGRDLAWNTLGIGAALLLASRAR